jgi:hypothetical protein
MFKNIQKYLLINHPLLWNLKIVPVSAFLILFNIIFILLGYLNGAIDFTETDNDYSRNDNDDIIIFFSVMISILTAIVWLVYYLKNNALKSYYPKNNFSLFKEWLLILVVCFLNSSLIMAYLYGKDLKVRSYYTESEAKKRCEILSQGSFFVSGSYSYHYNNDNYEGDAIVAAANYDVDTATAVVDSVKVKDHFFYRGRKYSNFSLLDKNINSYSFFGYNEDSLRKMKIKDWLFYNKKDSVKSLFKNYLAIVKEHKLKANIDEEKWTELVYDYPKFEKYKNIGAEEFEVSYDYENEIRRNQIDTSEQYVKKVKDTYYLYNKYYVPENSLKHSYETISNSWTKPSVSIDTILLLLYIAIGFSLVLFSFRVTSGRNFLIAIVALGVVNILIGILTAIISSEYFYLAALLLLTIILFVYLILVIHRKKGKGISGITLNATLWLLPSFGPIVYAIVLELAKSTTNYYDIIDIGLRNEKFPFISFLKDYAYELLWFNVLFIFLMMLFFSRKIKQWRGIAEN